MEIWFLGLGVFAAIGAFWNSNVIVKMIVKQNEKFEELQIEMERIRFQINSISKDGNEE
tara:strand:- start:417 stop:593 length:177 start_codon:yes stop_codon:yes gene_type:complete